MKRTLKNDVGSYTSTYTSTPNEFDDGFTEPYNKVIYPEGLPFSSNDLYIDDVLTIYPMEYGDYLFSKGDNTTVSLYNIYVDVLISNSVNGSKYYRQIDNNRVLIIYKDDTSEYIDDGLNLSLNGGYYDLNFTFNPKKDVKKIEVHTTRHLIVPTVNVDSEVIIYGGDGSSESSSVVVQSTEEAGLLKNLIKWIQDIFNSIKELPFKIWEVISEGLKNLFVPDGLYIADYKFQWEELLSSRFGALYEGGNLVISLGSMFLDAMTSGNPSSYITFPEVEVFFGDVPFVFGGWEVSVVPQGFEFLADIVRGFSILLMLFAFLNALRKRYDKLVGDES